MGHVQVRERYGHKRYVARYLGPDGREHTKSFERRRDAVDWLGVSEAGIRRGDWIDPASTRLTVGEWCEQWYAGRIGIAPATLDSYRTMLDVDLLPVFGEIRLRSLSTQQIRTWVRGMTTNRPWVTPPAALAVSTASTRRAVFASILRAAVEEGALARSPMLGVKSPQRAVETGPLDPEALPTAAQVWALHDAAAPLIAEAIIVAAGSGLRQGEILGLRARNARLLRRELEVLEQIRTVAKGQPEYAPPKSPRSRRRIPVGDEVCHAIARHLAQWPAEPDQSVFRREDGGLWRRTTFAYAWKAAKAAAGVSQSVRWHELRHFYASTLIDGGASVREVMDRMGHTSAEETIARYSRLWPDRDETTRAIADRALRRPDDGAQTGQK